MDINMDINMDMDMDIASGSSEEYKWRSAVLSAEEFDPLRTVSGHDWVWNEVDKFLQPINTQDILKLRVLPPSSINWDIDLELPPLDNDNNDTNTNTIGDGDKNGSIPAARLNSTTFTERMVAALLEVPKTNANDSNDNDNIKNKKKLVPQEKTCYVQKKMPTMRAVRKPELVEKRVVEELLDHGLVDKQDNVNGIPVPTRLETKIRIMQVQLRDVKDKNTTLQKQLSENTALSVRQQSIRRENQLNRDFAEMTYLTKSIRKCKNNIKYNNKTKKKKKHRSITKLEEIKGRQSLSRRIGKNKAKDEDDSLSTDEEEGSDGDELPINIRNAPRARPSKVARAKREEQLYMQILSRCKK